MRDCLSIEAESWLAHWAERLQDRVCHEIVNNVDHTHIQVVVMGLLWLCRQG
jgi:hypothetical protein